MKTNYDPIYQQHLLLFYKRDQDYIFNNSVFLSARGRNISFQGGAHNIHTPILPLRGSQLEKNTALLGEECKCGSWSWNHTKKKGRFFLRILMRLGVSPEIAKIRTFWLKMMRLGNKKIGMENRLREDSSVFHTLIFSEFIGPCNSKYSRPGLRRRKGGGWFGDLKGRKEKRGVQGFVHLVYLFVVLRLTKFFPLSRVIGSSMADLLTYT